MKKENGKSIFHKAGNALKGIKDHWKTPAEGKYIPYKEVVSYSVGGIGVKFVNKTKGCGCKACRKRA